MHDTPHFEPLQRMERRALRGQSDSDTTYFFDLMNASEMAIKIAITGMVAGIADDADRNRYRIEYELVRADSIGAWIAAFSDVVAGRAAQYLVRELSPERRELQQKSTAGSWQHAGVTSLIEALKAAGGPDEPAPHMTTGLKWFELFAQLRNATRGHGAPPAATCTLMAFHLERACSAFFNGFGLFQRPWAYLHRNLSGKFRTTQFGKANENFDQYSRSKSHTIADGVYLWAGEPLKVNLLFTDADISDFFLPNGNFKEAGFELLSYISGDRRVRPSGDFMRPPGTLPASETEGLRRLEAVGETLTNVPAVQAGYVPRPDLEYALERELAIDDRHPIITLAGSGGVGKTSLAITVSRRLMARPRFTAALWFSARDIDLTTSGPKPVRPRISTQTDLASEYWDLISPNVPARRDHQLREFESALNTTPHGGPLLVIIDNFETVSSRADLFQWLDAHVRPPNKVLITSRSGDFSGDVPIRVAGMTDAECTELIDQTAARLGIAHLIDLQYRTAIIAESGGHPYVIKILLGEAAKARGRVQIQRIMADQSHILGALFERTYQSLTPGAQKIFLTLCSWRSVVPRLAVEAAMFRPENAERFDVEACIDELVQSSFVDQLQSAKDDEHFLSTPLAAIEFGRPKIFTSPFKSQIDSDAEVLRLFGASQQSAVKHGIEPRIEHLFRNVASANNLESHSEMLEYVASRHPRAWLLLAELYMESGSSDKALVYAKRFIESAPLPAEARAAWEKVARIASQNGDALEEINAVVELAELGEMTFRDISNAANSFNRLIKDRPAEMSNELKRAYANRIAFVMHSRKAEADATDFSRLGWLYVNTGDIEKAYAAAKAGVDLEPGNSYCDRLLRRLTSGG